LYGLQFDLIFCVYVMLMIILGHNETYYGITLQELQIQTIVAHLIRISFPNSYVTKRLHSIVQYKLHTAAS
jgi:hypothetical protein